MNLTAWRTVAGILGLFLPWARGWAGAIEAKHAAAIYVCGAAFLVAAVVPEAWRLRSGMKAAFGLLSIALIIATAYLVYGDLIGPYIVDYVGAFFNVP